MTIAFHEQAIVFLVCPEWLFFHQSVRRACRTAFAHPQGKPCTDLSTNDVDKQFPNQDGKLRDFHQRRISCAAQTRFGDRRARRGLLWTAPMHSPFRAARGLPVPLPRLFDYRHHRAYKPSSVAISQRILVPFGAAAGGGRQRPQPGRSRHRAQAALALPDAVTLLQGRINFARCAGWPATCTRRWAEVLAAALPVALLPRRAVAGHRRPWLAC